MRSVIVFVLVACAAGAVRAQPAPAADDGAVALLPLDADQQLAIYGQPVASELARALGAGGVDVVVVGPKAAVPTRARLIVDGTIHAKGQAVVLSVRVRDPRDGTVLATLEATAPQLTSIDKAAAQLSARVLPAVAGLLAKRREAQAATAAPPVTSPAPPATTAKPDEIETLLAPRNPMEVAVTIGPKGDPSAWPLRDALTTAVKDWGAAHHRTAVPYYGKGLRAQYADPAVIVEVEAYTVEPGLVPLARARVHLRVLDRTGVAFDRTLVTDTIVGDRGIAADALAARTAREVLAIAEPHVRRLVPSWR